MKLIGKLVIVSIACLLALNAHAHNALFAVTPQENQAGGLFFKITSEPLADGGARFRVVITENQTNLNSHPLAELGILESTRSARSIAAGRKIPCTREGKALVCVFSASHQELANPDFCFFFSNLDHALENKFLFLLSKDFVFARLHDFTRPHR
jgi:hypothetical protein